MPNPSVSAMLLVSALNVSPSVVVPVMMGAPVGALLPTSICTALLVNVSTVPKPSVKVISTQTVLPLSVLVSR